MTVDGKIELGPSSGGFKLTPKGEPIRFLHAAKPIIVVETESAPKAPLSDSATIDPKVLERLSRPLVNLFPPGSKIVQAPDGILAAWLEKLTSQ